MAIAFDAASNVAAGTGDLTWQHTPVGTPRGALIIVVANTADAAAMTCTYGGVTATAVLGSPFLQVGDTPGGIWTFFLGANVPTGVQTIVVDTNSTVSRRAVAITLTADADMEVDTTEDNEGTQSTLTVTLATTTDRETFCASAYHSQRDAVTAFAADASQTTILEHDFGFEGAGWARRTINATGGNVDLSWAESGGQNNGLFGIAIGEAEAQADSGNGFYALLRRRRR